MIHNRLHIVKNIGIKNTGLTKRYPIFQSGIGKKTFGNRLTDCVMVIDADLNRVTGSAPMNGSVSVAGLGNRAYVYNLNGIGIGLRFNSVNDVLHCGDVCEHRLFRIVVGRRRNKSADMDNKVGTGYTGKNIFVHSKVAPIKRYMGIIYIRSKLVSVLLAVTVEQNNIV